MNLHKLLKPRGLAVVGASERSGFGRDTCQNILDYTRNLDQVYFVNPGRDEVFGRKCYRSLADIAAPVDLVIICTPQASVAGLIEEAAAKGCGAAVVFASGYGEAGPEGRRAQDELVELCEKHGIAMMGPNCAGFANYPDEVFSFAFLTEKRDRRGDIAILSQSGQIILSALDCPHLKFSYLISSGNSASIKLEEYLEFLVEDDQTKVVAAYIEGVTRPDIFVRALEKAAARHKPVVVLKGGRSAKGSQLAASHTGSLAGSDGAIDAVFKRFGVIRVDDIQELLGAAAMFSTLPKLPLADEAASLNVSGGEAGVAADMGMLYEVPYADLGPETAAGLKAMLPSYSTPSNPLDMTASIAYDPERICRGLELFMREEKVGLVMIDYTVTPQIIDTTIPCLIAGLEKALAQPWCTKPILWVPYIEHTRHPESAAKLAALKVPLLPSGVYSFKLINKLLEFARFVRKNPKPEVCLPRRARGNGPRRAHTEYDSRRMLLAHGIGEEAGLVARSAEEARAAADQLGPPVALKINSPDILHKSDVGGVALNIKTGDEAARIYDTMMTSLRVKRPEAFLDGVLVQRMMRHGLEFIIGLNNDPQFGPMIMAGLGGVFVEVFRDVQLRPAPIGRAEARDMLSKLRGYTLLTGYRGEAEMDVEALADLVARVSDFAAHHRDEVLELDLNPVFVYPKGQGVGLADALIITQG